MSDNELFNLLLHQKHIKHSNTSKNLKKKDIRFLETRKESECLHDNIITEKGTRVCTDCGEEISNIVDNEKEWNYYGDNSKRSIDPNRVQARRNDDKSIYKDVEHLGFNDHIITKANKLYEEVSGGHIYRGDSRKGIIFACVFHACKQSKNPYSHSKLLEIFNIERKTGLDGLKKVHLKVGKGSTILTTYITPLNLVEEIMNDFSATDEQKREVTDLYKKIENRSSKLNRSRPQSIASGLVYYWIKHKDNKISLKEFAQKVSLSELTINKIAKEISEILK